MDQPCKVCIIIPAYNEEESVPHVIRSIRHLHPTFDVLVVNDGSTDQTASVAREAGATVVTLLQNLGIGGAVQTGFIHAVRSGYDVAVQVDADGQHKAEELPKILAPIYEGVADMVVGSRFGDQGGYQSTPTRRVGILLLSTIVSLFARQRLRDVTSGFRAVNRQGITLFAREYATDYPEVDSLLLAKREGLRLQEVAVAMEPRQAGRSSITALKSAYYMIKVTLAVLMRGVR